MIIFKANDKKQIIALLEENIKLFIFPGVPGETIRHIRSHLDWLRAQPEDLNVTCRLETFPETKATTLHITATFQPRVAQ